MPTVEEIEKAYKELLDESNDRAVAIVGATLVEAQLEDAIVRRLLPMSSNHRKALFQDEYGYTFASKIDLGLSLGLFGQKTKTDLHRIRKIRNEFAHNLDRSFASPEVIKVCKELTNYIKKGKPIAPEILEKAGELRGYIESREWRWRFATAATHITLGLIQETIERVEPPKPKVLKD